MRTTPTEPEGFSAEHSARLAALAHNINLPGLSVASILNQFGKDRAPVLIKVLQCFQDGFSWAKAGAVLHSDREMALAMIQKVAADLGQALPPKPPMESKSV